MTTFYALDAACYERDFAPIGESVPEDRWRELVERAIAHKPSSQPVDFYLGDAVVPRIDGGRALVGKGIKWVELSRVLFNALLADCCRASWDPAWDNMFMDLVNGTAVPDLAEGTDEDEEDPFTPAMALAWHRLLAIVQPAMGVPPKRIDTPMPPWLEMTYEDMGHGLIAPDRLADLVVAIRESGLMPRLARAALDVDDDLEPKLDDLLAFLEGAAGRGDWVMGTEWGD